MSVGCSGGLSFMTKNVLTQNKCLEICVKISNSCVSLFVETFETMDTDKDNIIQLNFFQVWPHIHMNRNTTIYPNNILNFLLLHFKPLFISFCVGYIPNFFLTFHIIHSLIYMLSVLYSGLPWPCLPRDKWTPLYLLHCNLLQLHVQFVSFQKCLLLLQFFLFFMLVAEALYREKTVN